MKSKPYAHILTVGLAIFSMFFGAGNLVYPLSVGMYSGSLIIYGMAGFILTAVLLPLMGLIAMILFDGNYEAFFSRAGVTAGKAMIFLSMMVIGPVIAIPRIVTLSHVMIAPFLPSELLQQISLQSSFLFAMIFLSVTYLATFRENRIVNLLGNVISPLLIVSLTIIIFKGIFSAQSVIETNVTPWQAFVVNFTRGYETLDLLGGIFFSSIVIHIMKNTVGGMVGYNRNRLALIGLKSGALGVTILALIYLGMGYLSIYHGHDLAASGDLFRMLAFRVLGNHGALTIATAVLMACFSTAIALGAVVGDYFHVTVFNRTISYELSLLFILLLSVPLSTFGLDRVLELTGGPLVWIGYPVLVMITFCNIAYKLFGFKPIKVPVAATFIGALISYYFC